MRNTTHYNLNIVEGADIVNPLVVDNPNYEAIDEAMWNNAVAGIPVATELKGGTIHAITRSNREASMFRFVATSDFVAGETFTVDGVQVTAYTTNSVPLATNAYRIGASVIGCLVDTVLTLFVATPITVAEDSEKLGGQLPNYYATQTGLDGVSQVAKSAGALAQQASNQVVSLLEPKLLWSRNDDTAQQTAINIPVDLVGKHFIIFTGSGYYTNTDRNMTGIIPAKAKSGVTLVIEDSGTPCFRSVTIHPDGTKIIIGDARRGTAINNQFCVVKDIYYI